MTRADERKLRKEAKAAVRILWFPSMPRAKVVRYLLAQTGIHIGPKMNGLTDVQLHDIIAVCKAAPKRADGTLDWEG